MNKLVEVESIETSIPNIRIFKIGKILCVTIVNADITNAGVIFTIPPNIKILHSTVFAAVNSDNHSSEIEINANGIIRSYGNAYSVSGTGIALLK